MESSQNSSPNKGSNKISMSSTKKKAIAVHNLISIKPQKKD